LSARWAMPNWCNPCGRYHPRDWQDCKGRAANRHHDEPAIDLDKLAELVAEKVAEKLARGGRM
jgi:hypothetical protein